MSDETKTCGDCEHHDQSEGISCRAPLPIWVYNVMWDTNSKSPKRTDRQAEHCLCFERKAKP